MPDRGESLEKKYFWPAIQSYFEDSEVVWLEEIGFLDKNHTQIQETVLSSVVSKKPDMVFFILMKDEIKLETILKISDQAITINWFSDDHWRFDSWSKDLAKVLHYAVTVDKYSLSSYKEIGKAQPILSQWGCFELPQMHEKELGEFFKCDVSFVGTKNIIREWYVHKLREKNIIVECYGSGWENGRVDNDEMNQIFKRSRINLNLSNSVPKDIRFLYYVVIYFIQSLLSLNFNKMKYYRKGISQFFKKKTKAYEQLKARNFEIPSAGGFQLSHYALELEDYFMIGKEVAIYATCDELLKQVEYYLNNPELTQEIRLNSFRSSRLQTFTKRVHDFCDIITQKVKR